MQACETCQLLKTTNLPYIFSGGIDDRVERKNDICNATLSSSNGKGIAMVTVY